MFQNQPTTDKIVIGCFVVAVGAQLAAFVWNLFLCAWCFCENCLVPVLPLLAFLSTASLVTALVVFAVNADVDVQVALGDVPTDWDSFQVKSSLGYSLWVGIAAAVAMALATLMAMIFAKQQTKNLGKDK